MNDTTGSAKALLDLVGSYAMTRARCALSHDDTPGPSNKTLQLSRQAHAELDLIRVEVEAWADRIAELEHKLDHLGRVFATALADCGIPEGDNLTDDVALLTNYARLGYRAEKHTAPLITLTPTHGSTPFFPPILDDWNSPEDAAYDEPPTAPQAPTVPDTPDRATRGVHGAPGPAAGPTQDQPAPTGCPTCTGPVRETAGMVCQTCGTDYAPATACCEHHLKRPPGQCDGACCHQCPDCRPDRTGKAPS